MPHALNPEDGFIVSANQKIVLDDFPFYMGKVFVSGEFACAL
jgi:acyl-homoserine lactone acylase PvdQ